MAIYEFSDPYGATLTVELTMEEETRIASHVEESTLHLRRDDMGNIFVRPKAETESEDGVEWTSIITVPAILQGERGQTSVRMTTEIFARLIDAASSHRGGKFDALDITHGPPAEGSS